MLLSVGVIHTFNFYEGNSLHEPGGGGAPGQGRGRCVYRALHLSHIGFSFTFDV